MAFRLPKAVQARPDGHALLWLSASVALGVAGHAGHLPLWLMLVIACLMTWRYLALRRGWRLPGITLRIIASVALVIALYQHYGLATGRVAGAGWLAGMVGLKFLELRTVQRDFALVILMGLFLVLGVALLRQDLWTGAYVLTALLVALAALNAAVQPGLSAARSMSTAGRIALAALPLALVFYLFFPRLHGSLWGIAAEGGGGVTGFSGELRPGSISALFKSDEVAFRVRFDDRIPPPVERYWRGMILTQTDGAGWTAGNIPPQRAKPLRVRAEPIDYEITLEPHQRKWVFLLDLPAAPPAGSLAAPGFTARWAQPVTKRRTYRARSYARYNTGPLSAAARARNLQLPSVLSARVRALAQQWKQDSANDLGVARAALTYFREREFRYTLRPPRLGDDPVDEFLFDTKSGYCEHYASAFATLMRAAGIPSRVVVGYQGAEYNPNGGYFVVRQSDAHAWAEIWTEPSGWLRIDPTTAVAPERIEYGSSALVRLLEQGAPLGILSREQLRRLMDSGLLRGAWRQAANLWDALNVNWNRWVVGFNPQRQKKILRALGFRTPDWAALVSALTAGMILFFLLIALWIYATRERREPVVRLYAAFCRKLAAAGISRAAHEGPLAFAQRAMTARPACRREIESITGLYVRFRYAGHPGAALLNALRRRVRAFRVAA